MTYRDFYNAVINSNLSNELTEFATTALAKLDTRNAKRAEKPSKTALANAPIKESIVAFIATNGVKVAAEVAAALDISTNKASALCVQLTKEGRLVQSEMKVPKKGKVKAYNVAVVEDGDNDTAEGGETAE